MELRDCEEKINELKSVYGFIRNQVSGTISLQKLGSGDDDSSTDKNINNISDESSSLETVVNSLHKAQFLLEKLAPKIQKFQKRLEEKDPVTGNPRYGEKTQTRVTAIVSTYTAIRNQIPSDDDSNHPLLHLNEEYQRQQGSLKRKEILKAQEELRRRKEGEKLKQEQLEKKEMRKKQQEEQLEKQRSEQEALLRAQAIEARNARLHREQQEQEWFDSIKKGKEGVKCYLEKLKESTINEPPGVQRKAFLSLLTIFQQINAHPEEIKFRRIRRTHEQFVQDVGRHEGGIEVLIAGGFVLGSIDDVPCYLSKEPDVEKDMEKWSEWFEINNSALELLERASLNL
jgi:hypothetical protein